MILCIFSVSVVMLLEVLVGITVWAASFDLLESAVHEFMPFWPLDNNHCY